MGVGRGAPAISFMNQGDEAFFYQPAQGAFMYLPDTGKEEMQGNILARLKKIEGQIRGLQAMVAENKECDQILAQVRAAQSALKAVNKLIIKSYLLKSYYEVGPKPSPEDMLQRLDKVVGVLTKFIGP
jgi:DNA-binding FrmR family transcriptional regulator